MQRIWRAYGLQPPVQAWLTRPPGSTCTSPPTSSSWPNLVERWFRDLTDKRLRVDTPLQRLVTSPEMAARVREIDDPSTGQGNRLDSPVSLTSWFPERPYSASSQFVRRLEGYNRDLEEAERGVERYDTVLIVGGSGALVDLANNQRVHDLILAFLRAGKPVGAECYGVTCVAFARDMNLRQSLIWGKHVTGHCLEYDYHDGTAFVEAHNKMLDVNFRAPFIPLEFILRNVTGPDGGYHGNFGNPTSVIVDYPFITGRSTPDSIPDRPKDHRGA